MAKSSGVRPLGGAEHEHCYFVVPLPSGDLIVGGRHGGLDDTGRSVPGVVHGIIWRVEPRSGTIRPGSPREFAAVGASGAAARSAFQMGTMLSDGSLVLGGWVTDDARKGDDVWLIRMTSDLQKVWERAWRGSDAGDNLGESVIARKAGDVVVFGQGVPAGTTITRGLAAAFDADGRVEWSRFVDGGADGPDSLHDGIEMSDGRLFAVGATKQGASTPSQGWLVELDRSGLARPARIFSELTGGQLYGIASGSDQKLVLVGTGRGPDRRNFDGWTVHLALLHSPVTTASPPAAPAPPGAPVVSPGTLDATQRQMVTTGRIGADQTQQYRFTLAASAKVQAVLVPVEGDLDLMLRAGPDVAPIASVNTGTATELIAAPLPAGEHVLEVIGNHSSSYRLIVRLAVPSKPSTPAITLEQQWDVDERRLVEHGLDLLGYVPGEVDGVFTGATRAAIRGFKRASMRQRPDGSRRPSGSSSRSPRPRRRQGALTPQQRRLRGWLRPRSR